MQCEGMSKELENIFLKLKLFHCSSGSKYKYKY